MPTIAALERLNRLLDEKEEEIFKLKEQVESLEARIEHTREFPSVPPPRDRPNLPVPRLEMVYVPCPRVGWANYLVVQRLVFQHFLGHLDWAGIDWTRVSSGRVQEGPPMYEGHVDLPFRSGSHVRANALLLKLPVFTVVEPIGQIQERTWPDEKNTSMMEIVQTARREYLAKKKARK